MPTEHCSLCEEGKPCGNHHLYVIEFRKEVAGEYAKSSYKGYLYVGSTGKSVEERFDDTFRLKDGTKLSIEEGRKRSDEKVWKYNTENMRRIRRHYLKHRPDLLYRKANPIEGGKEAAERREKKLVRRLTKRGWKVEGPRKKEK